jgi:Leucine-rich repeat (LRR) protein
LLGCENLKEFLQSIGSLSSVSMLNWSDYRSIESLPTTICQLQNLTHLLLQRCENLQQLPQSIANLSSWTMLDLSGYNSIESLPTTINQLQHWLARCENL